MPDPLFHPSNGTSTHTRDVAVPSADAVTTAQDHGFGVADFALLTRNKPACDVAPQLPSVTGDSRVSGYSRGLLPNPRPLITQALVASGKVFLLPA